MSQLRKGRRTLAIGFLGALTAAVVQGQAFNIDFGPADEVPPAHYAAAGRAGVWIGLLAPHGSTTTDLLDVDGVVTDVSVRQLGGTDNRTVDDPGTLGEDGLLLDDYLVTFSAAVETCLFFENLEPGPYEVLIYGWMPSQPTVFSYTVADQEPGLPHYIVGGPWGGMHEELVTYSRHLALVQADGILNLHSGIVPGANAGLGAALNAVQIRPLTTIFADGFESGDSSAWSATVP